MVILCIGDVVGAAGCAFLREKLSAVKRFYGIDITVVNGENSAEGNGMTPASAQSLLDAGADVVTGGNHTFRRREIYPVLEDSPSVLRPANYPPCAPGRGFVTVDALRAQVAVVSLLGTAFMEPLDNPFACSDAILSRLDPAALVVVDFHAEATSEKRAMAFHLDGRVSVLVGTHTHVQTADEQILERGTGYITDLGMTGPIRSVLGVEPRDVLQRYLTHMPARFSTAAGPCMLSGAVFEIDNKTRITKSVQRVQIQ